MAVIEGVDFANPRPDPAALAAAGVEFVARYLSPNTSANPGKRLTRVELAGYLEHGLAVCVVWETTTVRATQGRSAGQEDAAAADAVRAALGMPVGQPIYFAVDEDTTGAVVADYFRGAADRIGVARIGAYAGIRPIAYLFDHGLITYGWQTLAWSGGRWDKRAQVQQYHNGARLAGVVLDLDRATVADYGQWEADMPVSQDDINAIAAAVTHAIFNTPATVPNISEDPDYKTLPDTAFDTALVRIRAAAADARDASRVNAATLAGVVKSEAAIQATLMSLAPGAPQVDTAALAAAIKAIGDAQTARDLAAQQQIAALTTQVTSLRAALAKAAGDEAADLAVK